MSSIMSQSFKVVDMINNLLLAKKNNKRLFIMSTTLKLRDIMDDMMT